MDELARRLAHMSIQSAGEVPTITVAHRLRIAREYAGLEQAELGDLIGVSRGTISRAERGLGHTRAVLMAWAMASGVPLLWLETGQAPTDEPGPDDGVRRQGLEPRTRWLDVTRSRRELSRAS